MQYTSNYRLKKQELTDKADITQISENWDTIDRELATVDGKSGGAITGDVEINGHLSTEGFNTKHPQSQRTPLGTSSTAKIIALLECSLISLKAAYRLSVCMLIKTIMLGQRIARVLCANGMM